MSDMEARVKELEDAQHIAALTAQRIEGKVDRVLIALENTVLQVEFKPVRALVFGGVGIILTTALAAVLGFVIVKNG